MGKFGESILRKVSRDHRTQDYINEEFDEKNRDASTCASYLTRVFPTLTCEIQNKDVLDIGCSKGVETLALSIMGAKKVHGIDIRLGAAHKILERNPGRKLSFSTMNAENLGFPNEIFDIIITCSSMEHFNNPHAVLKECKRVLRYNGKVFLTSGVWSHPWGAHMNFFTKVPWVQYIFSEDTIMKVRSQYRMDGAKKYSDVEGGLNKIGIRSFKRMSNDLGFEIIYFKLNPVKGLTVLTSIPFLNEYFTNLIVSVLQKI